MLKDQRRVPHFGLFSFLELTEPHISLPSITLILIVNIKQPIQYITEMWNLICSLENWQTLKLDSSFARKYEF